MASWREVFTAEQRKLPTGASPKERGEATRRASRIYRGHQLRSNPDGKQLAKAGLIAAAVYLAYTMLNKPPVASAPLPAGQETAAAPSLTSR